MWGEGGVVNIYIYKIKYNDIIYIITCDRISGRGRTGTSIAISYKFENKTKRKNPWDNGTGTRQWVGAWGRDK